MYDQDLLLISILTSLNFVFFMVGLWLYYRARSLLKGASSRSLTRLELEMTELGSRFESLCEAHKRLSSRIGMREVREKRKGGENTDVDTSTNGVDRARLKELARQKGLLR